MNTVRYLVTLRLPDEIQPEQGIRELQTCITFGQAEVSLLSAEPDPIPGHDGAPEPAPNELTSGFSTDGPAIPPMRS
jgi:hypothetical protein